MNKNFEEVPITMDKDINQDASTWRDNKYISIDEGTHVTVYIAHYTEQSTDVEGKTINMMRAYRDWETDRKSTRLNSSHSAKSRMPSSA